MKHDHDLSMIDLTTLMLEQEVYEQYPKLFTKGELAQLRKEGRIGCIPISRERIFYRPEDITAYLAQKYRPATQSGSSSCQEKTIPDQLESARPVSSNTKAIGSVKTSQEEPDTSSAGCTAEMLNAASLLLKT